MDETLEFAKLKITEMVYAASTRNSVKSGALVDNVKVVHEPKSNKYTLNHRFFEPDHPLSYQEFLNRNPLRNLKGRKELKPQKKMDLGRIEETYWSQWKPNKNSVLIEPTTIEDKKVPSRAQKMTRGEGDSGYNMKSNLCEMITRKTALDYKQFNTLPKIDELTEDDKNVEASSSTSKVKDPKDIKFLKHTDSFILISKRQLDEKPYLQQPKCIRLHKKTSSGSYVKGGSYPLKPCLKKESTSKSYSKRPISGYPCSANIFKSVQNKMKPRSIK